MNLREPRYDCDHDRLAEHVARLEQPLFAARERIGIMEEDNARLQAENQQLRDENERLKQQLATARKDSSTSSKPPSSDIATPKKPPTQGGKKRKKGGQPRHEQPVRSPFLPEAVDHFERPRSTAVRVAAADWFVRGASRKCSRKWKSPRLRPSSQNTRSLPPGARTAGTSITLRCPGRSTRRGCSACGEPVPEPSIEAGRVKVTVAP